MSKYNVPLKVAFTFYSIENRTFDFKKVGETTIYTCDLFKEDSLSEGKIISKLDDGYFGININQQIQVPGDILKSLWNCWRNGGEHQFNEWHSKSLN